MIDPLIAGIFTISVVFLNELLFVWRERRNRNHRLLEYILPERIKAHTEILRRIAELGMYENTVTALAPQARKRFFDEISKVALELFYTYAVIAGSRVLSTLLDIHVISGEIVQYCSEGDDARRVDKDATFQQRLDTAYNKLMEHCRKDAGSNAVDDAIAKIRDKPGAVGKEKKPPDNHK